MDFDPTYFLRCHSRKNDNADHQTQVWMCAFEPDPVDTDKTTTIIATCGGNIVCFIDVRSGEVLYKYITADFKEMFYTLAWTILPNRESVLVCAGLRNVLHFINKTHETNYLQFPLNGKLKFRVQGLLFHPKQYNILFCGTSDGDIRLYDIGNPASPDYESDLKALAKFSVESEIFSLAFCSFTKILLAGCNDGLRGLYVGDIAKTDKQPNVLTFKLPLSDANNSEELVDSVEVLKDGVIAVKCALQGCFYVWHLPSTVGRITDSKSTTSFTVAPTHLLHWSDTDNYFMYSGSHMGAGLLACGDDEGSLWVYDIKDLDFLHKKATPVVVDPAILIPWPVLTDLNNDKRRKLHSDIRGQDIVIDKVAIDSTGQYLAAVTNNNLVCIWQRC